MTSYSFYNSDQWANISVILITEPFLFQCFCSYYSDSIHQELFLGVKSKWNDWLILMASQPIYGYFMPKG